MRTLFAKILLWFWCTVAITVVGSAFISALSVNDMSSAQSPGARLVTFQLEEARTTYETGGRPALETFLENLHNIYGRPASLRTPEAATCSPDRTAPTSSAAPAAALRSGCYACATT
jgi:hypothetical protein